MCEHIEGGYCGRNYVWKNQWPKFGRLFHHGHVDTTNLAERHWQFIKYISLRGIINQSITNALIRDNVSGTWIGWTMIEWYMQKQE